MVRRLLVLTLVLGMGSVANAIPSFDLIPDMAGPYDVGVGGTLNVDIMYNNDTPDQQYVRLVMMNFVDSAPELVISNLAFDFSAVTGGALYNSNLTGTLLQAAYTATSPIPGFIYDVAGNSSIRLATMQVEIPLAEGSFLLDARNADDGGPNDSSRITHGFENPIELFSNDGSLGGGTLDINVVVPEPATLALLGFGGLAAAMRRRRNAKV